MMLIAPLAWIGLALFTRFVPPQTVLAFITVFVLLGVALTSTLSPIAYFVVRRFLSSRLYRATVRHGVSTITWGLRFTLGIIFHNAE